MVGNTMVLGAEMGGTWGMHPGAWRMPWADPDGYTDVHRHIRAAQVAERGGLDFLFYPDRVFIWGDLESGPPIVSIDPLMLLAAIAPATSRIGLVPSMSTSFSEPYDVARHLRALDVMSHGRAGWNLIPSYEPEAFANYGRPVPTREDKYERLHEVLQISQALWASWGRAAGRPNKATGQFADTTHINPVSLQGRHVAARGPLQIPPSEQGQPVVFMPFASGLGVQAAAMYANGIIGMPASIEQGRSQREMIRSLAHEAGREQDEVKYVAFAAFGLGATEQEAVERRMALEEAAGLDERVAHLSQLLGQRINPADRNQPLTAAQMQSLTRHSGTQQEERAHRLATLGRTPLEILGNGALDPVPGMVGTAEQVADMAQEWVESGAVDGFCLGIDDLHDGLEDFVDHVIPVLRRRGLRHDDYQGHTLRDHLGISEQLGLDQRLSQRN